jgi:hypothetical protein
MILRDYLVALGFKIDENGWRDFNEKLQISSRNAARFGSTVAAAATEIGVATERVARQYEELYYVQQRVGSNVSGIKAIEFGMKQIGSSAEAGRGAIEGMAAAARMNPGLRAMFKGMGIDMSNPVKGIGQLADVMKARFGEAGYFVGARFAGMAGIDETTFRQIWMNREKLKRQETEHARRQKEAGIDADKFAKDSVKFGDSLRELYDRWDLLIERVAQDWLPVAQKTVDFGNAITKWLTDANTASQGWLGTLASIAAALGTLRVAGAALGAAGRLVGLGGGAAGGAGAAAGASGLGLRAGLMRGGVVGGAIGALGVMKYDKNNSVRDQLRGAFGIKSDKEALATSIVTAAQHLGIDPVDLATAISYETAGTFDSWKKGPTTQHGEHRGLIQWGEPQRAKYGVTKDSSIQQQMTAVEKYLADAGVKPGMKLLDIYSAINAGRVGRNNASDANNGGAPGTVADKVGGMGAHRDKARALLSETPLLSSGAGSSVTISQKNDIKVSGVSDPSKAASSVGGELARVTGDLVRNTASAVQ